jgi:uncharacterized protein (TIGR03086 family)
MSENLRNFTKAMYGFDAVIRRVPAGAWENQSPCTEWKAMDVVGHVVGGTGMIRAFATGTPLGGERPSTRALAGTDPFASWAAGRDAALEALDHPDALHRVAATPFGEMPVDNFLGIFCTDVVTHTWDLARAVGIEACVDLPLAARLYEGVKPMDAMLRGPGLIDDKKTAPSGVGPVEEMMAFLGRAV